MFPPSQTASGVRQKDIAEKVGLTQQSVSHIVKGNTNNLSATEFTNSDLTVTAKLKDELEALRRRLDEAEAARGGAQES